MKPSITCPKCLSRRTKRAGHPRGAGWDKIKCLSCKKYSLVTGKADEFEAWDFGDAKTEAHQCLRIARSNGGIPKMRETIAVTHVQRAVLQKFAIANPEFASNVEKAIRYREVVLEIFDSLASSEEEKPVAHILARPLTAEEIASVAHLLSPRQLATEMQKATR
jgi:hypothetical protein